MSKTKPQNILFLGTDDIEIDEPNPPIIKTSTSSPDVKNKQKGKSLSQNMYHILTTKISDSFFLLPADKLRDREKLFEGGTNKDDVKPRLRTPEEIMAAYRKTGVVLSCPSSLSCINELNY